MFTDIFIGLGSNVGNRLDHLRWAVSAINRHQRLEVIKGSSIFESEAHTWDDHKAQDAYFNAVLMMKGTLAPDELLQFCLLVERQRGRLRSEGAWWEPRTLDLDVLAFGSTVLSKDDLVIPHPRIHMRQFVLQPWSEIAPGFIIPDPYNKSVVTLLAECTDAACIDKTAYQLLD